MKMSLVYNIEVNPVTHQSGQKLNFVYFTLQDPNNSVPSPAPTNAMSVSHSSASYQSTEVASSMTHQSSSDEVRKRKAFMTLFC